MSEEEIIRIEFQNVLDKLVSSKIRPTATEIISARQPMVQLFEEVMFKLDKLQKENKKLKKESKNSMEARNIMAQEVFRLQKEVKEKDKKWIDRINDSIIAYELSERLNYDKQDNSKIIEALKLLKGE